MLRILIVVSLVSMLPPGAAASCPDWLNVDLKKLRSQERVNLCQLKQDNVLLIVNTASQCGFTPQFKGLEELYKKYNSQGFEIVGFPSDSFRQEMDKEEDTAKICYVNYGVTFTMLSTSPVKGDDVNPVFAYLGEALGAPKWNFFKYLIAKDGKPVAVFPSTVTPMSETLVTELEKALQ